MCEAIHRVRRADRETLIAMRAIVFALVAAAQLHSQTAPRVEFEVVSVKPGDPNDPSSSGRGTPGGMEMHNTTLNTLVRSAYNLNEYQLVGGPKWAGSARFDVVGRFPKGAKRDQTPLMLQSMLADRFKLEFHRETRMLQQYELVVAKGGPKLQEASEMDRARSGTSQGPRMIKASSATTQDLAGMLISAVEAPVVDRTGIAGQYTIALRFVPLSGAGPGDENLPDVFGAVQQLGLKLMPVKGMVEVLVIDRAEMPSAN